MSIAAIAARQAWRTYLSLVALACSSRNSPIGDYAMMTSDAKSALTKTIRELREKIILPDLREATARAYPGGPARGTWPRRVGDPRRGARRQCCAARCSRPMRPRQPENPNEGNF